MDLISKESRQHIKALEISYCEINIYNDGFFLDDAVGVGDENFIVGVKRIKLFLEEDSGFGPLADIQILIQDLEGMSC